MRSKPHGSAAIAASLTMFLAACSAAEHGATTPRSTAGATALPTAAITATPAPAASPLDQALAAFQYLEAGDPHSLASRIGAVEQSLRSGSEPPADLIPLGQLEEVAYVQLAVQASWRAPVLAQLTGSAHDIAAANLAAAADIDTLNSAVAMLPHWRIESPEPAAALLGYYRQAQTAYGVPWQYLAAINLVETHMGRIHGLSSAGAQGPMQFLPATWTAYGQGGDVNKPADAIPAAARYLQAHGAPADMARAVHAYNPTDLYVDAVTRYAQQIASDMRAFYGYYAWPVVVSTTRGYALLPEGLTN